MEDDKNQIYQFVVGDTVEYPMYMPKPHASVMRNKGFITQCWGCMPMYIVSSIGSPSQGDGFKITRIVLTEKHKIYEHWQFFSAD